MLPVAKFRRVMAQMDRFRPTQQPPPEPTVDLSDLIRFGTD